MEISDPIVVVKNYLGRFKEWKYIHYY